jgi:Na+-driven multidrug efflux pump
MRIHPFFFRVLAVLLHALFNFILISYLTNFDITGSWLAVTAFLVTLVLLIALFIQHVISFINYIKTQTK